LEIRLSFPPEKTEDHPHPLEDGEEFQWKSELKFSDPVRKDGQVLNLQTSERKSWLIQLIEFWLWSQRPNKYRWSLPTMVGLTVFQLYIGAKTTHWVETVLNIELWTFPRQANNMLHDTLTKYSWHEALPHSKMVMKENNQCFAAYCVAKPWGSVA
jgi:hypothetical protein